MKSLSLIAPAAYLLAHASANQFVMYTGTTTPNGDDMSVQRADPILAPGKISGHVHQFTGSNGLAPEVSYESLQKATCTTVGASTGEGNLADKSIYWHPALFVEKADGSGFVRVPTLGHKFYYKDAGTGTKREPFEFPKGFRMLAGNPFMRAADEDLQRQNITQWVCHDSSGWNQGTAGGFPTGVTDCDSYPGFNGAIHLPHCWNGEDFNPADPGAHISYPDGDIENGECPSSHPTRLPHIFVENQFNLHDLVSKVDIKPDSFTLAQGDNTGYGWHFDFFNGWDEGAIPKLIENCPQGAYGNEDIGLCPDFQPGPKSDECKQSVSFVEKVDTPGKNLPGCNPVSDMNPAPKNAAAPLGTYSNQCNGAPAAPAPASSSATSTKAASTTMLTSAKPTKTGKPTKTAAKPTTKPTKTAAAPPPAYTNSGSSSEISCPDSNRQTYTTGGKTFRVQCGIDHPGGDMKSVTAHSLGECVDACAKTEGCVDVSLSGSACYLKSELRPKHKNGGVNGAKLVTAKTERREVKTFRERRHAHADFHRRAI